MTTATESDLRQDVVDEVLKELAREEELVATDGKKYLGDAFMKT